MNPGRVIEAATNKQDTNDIVRASTKAGRNSVAGTRAGNRVAEANAREQSGLPAAGGRASVARRASTRAGPGGRASVRAARASTRGKRTSVSSLGVDQSTIELGEQNSVDHIIVGAGVCGLIMAKECVTQNKTYMVLEKTDGLLG